MSEEDLEDWWENTVYQETGDGHGAKYPSLGCLYEVTVMEAPDFPKLVGQGHEWGG